MALGVSIRTVFARELATGLVIGALVGSLFFPFALAAWGYAEVAAAVAISLAVSCSVATLVAMALPLCIGAARPRSGVRLGSSGHRHPRPAVDRGVLRSCRGTRHLTAAADRLVR